MQKIVALLLFLPLVAFGSIYQRQHSATIASDKKIKGSELNDEYNAIATAVNSIDSTNITDGSLTATDFAATSTGISLNKKSGCDFSVVTDFQGSKTISIRPPCELYMDGTRGFITATSSISLLTDQDGFAPTVATYYFIYASRSSASLTFQFSTIAPTLATNRKRTNSNARYIGTIRTCDATTDIMSFRRMSTNRFRVVGATCGASLATPTILSTESFPNTIDNIYLRYTAYAHTFPAQCQFQDSSARTEYQAIVLATNGGVGLMPNAFLPGNSITVTNISNCDSGSAKVDEWTEPYSLHQ